MTVQNIVLLKFAKFIQRSIKNIPTVFLKWDIIWSANLETREAHIHPNHIQVTTPPPGFYVKPPVIGQACTFGKRIQF